MLSRAWKLRLAKRHFLVADDREMISLIVSYLKDMGVETIYCATHGRAALDMLNDSGKRVDVVIYDWDLPGTGGLEALRLVRRKFPHMPFLMLSANVTRESIAAAAKHRVDGYLAKPFSVQMLEQRVVTLARALPRGRVTVARDEPAAGRNQDAGDDAWVI